MTKIRPMMPEDVGQVLSIQEAITKKAVSGRWRRAVEKHFCQEDKLGLVAENGPGVVAFVIGEIKGEGFGSGLTGWIEVVGVMPQHRGSGIGTRLIKNLLDQFRAQGVSNVHTAVAWDAVDMLSFFKVLGFSRSDFIDLEWRS